MLKNYWIIGLLIFFDFFLTIGIEFFFGRKNEWKYFKKSFLENYNFNKTIFDLFIISIIRNILLFYLFWKLVKKRLYIYFDYFINIYLN